MNYSWGETQIRQSGSAGGNQGVACDPKHSGLIIIKSPPVWGALAVIGLAAEPLHPVERVPEGITQ